MSIGSWVVLSFILLVQEADAGPTGREMGEPGEWFRTEECAGPLFCDLRSEEAYERFSAEGGYFPGRLFELIERCLTVAELRFERPLQPSWFNAMVSSDGGEIFLILTPAPASVSVVTHQQDEQRRYFFNYAGDLPEFQCRFEVESSDPPFLTRMR